MNQGIHQEHISLTFGGNHSQWAMQSETGLGEVLLHELYPTFWGKVSMQFKRELPERNFGAYVALDRFHAMMELDITHERTMTSVHV